MIKLITPRQFMSDFRHEFVHGWNWFEVIGMVF